MQDGKYEEACACFERAQLSKRKQFNIFKNQAQIAIKQSREPNTAYRLIQISLQLLKEAGDDTSFFRQVLDHRIVSLLCKVGQKKEAKALLDQAVQVFRQLYPKDKDFFHALIKKNVFLFLYKTGDLACGDRLIQTDA